MSAEVAAVSSARPVASYAPPACRNCGVAMTSRYCPDCGQRAVLDRLSVGSLATDFAGQFLALDRGLWFTAFAVLRDPGGVARRWLDGQRRRYVGPVGFLSFGAALMLLGLQMINKDDIAVLRESARPLTTGPLAVLSPRQGEAYAQLMHAMAQQELLLSVLLAVPFALVARRLFRRAGVNLAEVGVMTLYAFADACLLYLPLIPVVRFLGDGAAGRGLRMWGTVAVYTIALLHAGWSFFGPRVGTVVRTLLALAITMVIFAILESAGPILYIRLTVPR